MPTLDQRAETFLVNSNNPVIRKILAEYRARFDLAAHLARQRAWSEETFGPGDRARGIVAHIRKELDEILEQPNDLEEWIDVVILALDGAWRAGGSPEDIIRTLISKQEKNEKREWPDWRQFSSDEAITHVKPADPAQPPGNNRPENRHPAP